jgi:hypothetical protein
MTSLMPETIEPATGTLPLPKVKYGRKRSRASWTGTQIALLVHTHLSGLPYHSDSGHTPTECEAKLIALGIVAKPKKASLGVPAQSLVDEALSVFDEFEDPERTLAIRYAIKALTALLPKRVAK